MFNSLLFSDIKVNDCLFHINPHNHPYNKQNECKIQMFIIKEIDRYTNTLFYLEIGEKSHELVKWNDLIKNEEITTTLCRTEALKEYRKVKSGFYSHIVRNKESNLC